MEICGYENYLIYEDGRVYSKYSKRYLKHNTHSKYNMILLYNSEGKRKSFTIHRLIALHYIPNPDNKPYIDHINRDKRDNRIENLQWVSASENGQNTGVQCNNKLGIKNISHHKRDDIYAYQKIIDGKRIIKRFKTLEEAIQFKNEYGTS